MAQSWFIFLTLFLAFSPGGCFYFYIMDRCQFSSDDGHDAVFLEQFYFNKMLEGQYISTVGEAIGYTKETQVYANILNNNSEFINHQIWKTNLCKRNSQLAYKELLTPVEPYVWLRSVKSEYSQHSHMLICSAFDFYPKQIKLTWLRDGKEDTSDVTCTDELPNGNWLYQLHTYLEFTPKPGEQISCMVEHASLREPKLYNWDPEPDLGWKKIVVGSVGLLLGLIFSITGFICYKKKSTELVLVPTTEEVCPEEDL
ncbi:H-2 class II histocompatibility antigen, E-S beta chain-like isoform X1 [Cyprinodon tularosa]|uniref:H-2 class II histocompatibility antigen, E-S beta chain-like isoform X1 n=1 Tax=Cyprinodon tularosa TaxID=77115 RepID=UPI0018E2499B|nr:H-2 class II histocompatibility antigen, E-S beta chain-like isoform X1 [Cyprinodon tularosa]